MPIIRKNFFGGWEIISRQTWENGKFISILFQIIMGALILVIIILPLSFWSSVVGFTKWGDSRRRRFWNGILSILYYIYLLIDIEKKWVISILFFGYDDSKGKHVNGWVNEKYLEDIYQINLLGVLVGVVFIIESYYLYKKSKTKDNFFKFVYD
jgi:hypothetical protein